MVKQEIARRMRAARLKQGLTQSQVAAQLGLSSQAISNYERGTNRIDSETLARLCAIYGISLDRLLGNVPEPSGETAAARDELPRGVRPYAAGVQIPLVGSIPAGVPVLARENVEDYRHAEVSRPEDYFFLRVRGDSMVGARIHDGDEVLIHRQNWASGGQVVACRVNGDEATLKRFKQMGDTVLLLPENPKYEPRILRVSDFDNGEASILGVVVEVRHRL